MYHKENKYKKVKHRDNGERAKQKYIEKETKKATSAITQKALALTFIESRRCYTLIICTSAEFVKRF